MASVATAQRTPASAGQPLRCASFDASRTRLGHRTLPNNYAVTISRSPEEVEFACIATLRGANGRIVRADSGFGAAVDEATGMDVDGDGTPELVLEMDTGGGNHCCWNYTVISLTRPAHLLFTFHWSGATEFRRDAAGRVTLWSWEGGLYGTEPSEASRLFAQKVYRYSAGTLVDITPGQCAAIAADTSRYQAKPPDADALRRLATFGARSDSAYGVATEIESLMLQEVFCQRFDRALDIAHTRWPPATRAAFIAHFRDLVVGAYPAYAVALKDWR